MRSFPGHWETVSLKEVVSYRKGKKPVILSNTKTAEMVPYIDIKAFSTGEIRQYADIKSSNLTSKEDVLVVWDGARSALVGKGQEGAIGSTIMALHPIEINSLYLFRFLQTQYETINSNPRGTGIPHVDPELFWNIKFPIAPLKEQRRIVAKLEKLLTKVEACQERLNKIPILLKRFRQSVLAAACSGRLTADWREQNSKVKPAEWLGDGDPPSDFDLPSTWNWLLSTHAFGFVTSGSRGWARYYSDKGAVFLRVGNLNHDSIKLDLRSIQRVSPPVSAEGRRTKVIEGDILISITADVGMVALVEAGLEEAYINQHVALGRPVGNMDRRYLAYFLAAKNGGQVQFLNLQRGATKVGLGLDDIRRIWIARPPLPEQHEIARHIEVLFKIADQIEERYKKAKAYIDKLTQSILAKAFRGELVPQNPNDEPVSELLKRIKKAHLK